MIVVIADDLSGAAELAGIGLRYGLHVEVNTEVDLGSDAELLVIATDTRSMHQEDAIIETAAVTESVLLLSPDLVYKKIDSVLRGHIIEEIKVQLKILNMQKALVVAGNPSLGRTISNGDYFYNDQPIHLSSFSNDPEFAVKSSNVLEMLRVREVPVCVRKTDDELPAEGIIVGEVTNLQDLQGWAGRVQDDIFTAGASGFFSAILDSLGLEKNKEKPVLHENAEPTLFICGTTFNERRDAIKEIKRKGGPVSYMPGKVISSEDFDEEVYQVWCNEIASFIHSKGKAIIAIDPQSVEGLNIRAASLRLKTAMVISEVFKHINIAELFIEGGSTAASIIRGLDIKSFIPIQELGPGVIRMRVAGKEDLCITVKPGSYQWPEGIWDFE